MKKIIAIIIAATISFNVHGEEASISDIEHCAFVSEEVSTIVKAMKNEVPLSEVYMDIEKHYSDKEDIQFKEALQEIAVRIYQFNIVSDELPNLNIVDNFANIIFTSCIENVREPSEEKIDEE